MKIHDPKAVTKETLLPIIKECFKDNLKSVILYGSAASELFNITTSDINILILLNKNISDELLEFGKNAKKAIEKYRFSILIFTLEEFIDSADVFPMEYYDINDRHIVIYGENISGKLKLTANNLRHQLEERLRGFVNQFRQSIIQSGCNKDFLRKNIKAVPGIIRIIMRSALRLKGIDVKDLSDNMIFLEVKRNYNIDISVFYSPSYTAKDQDIVAAVASTLDILDKIIAQIDAL